MHAADRGDQSSFFPHCVDGRLNLRDTVIDLCREFFLVGKDPEVPVGFSIKIVLLHERCDDAHVEKIAHLTEHGHDLTESFKFLGELLGKTHRCGIAGPCSSGSFSGLREKFLLASELGTLSLEVQCSAVFVGCYRAVIGFEVPSLKCACIGSGLCASDPWLEGDHGVFQTQTDELHAIIGFHKHTGEVRLARNPLDNHVLIAQGLFHTG